jgi:hypothetical protein
VELVAPAVLLAVFLAIYAVLFRRADRAGRQPAIRWGWLAAIIGCAALALLIGALTR